MTRRGDVLTERDIQNIEAVERGEMSPEDCVFDAERRMEDRKRRSRRRHNAGYQMDLYYVDGVTHWGYIPKEEYLGYVEGNRFHGDNKHTHFRHIADGRMTFERLLDYDPYHEANRRYDADYITPRAKKLYDFPNKRLDIKRFCERMYGGGRA